MASRFGRRGALSILAARLRYISEFAADVAHEFSKHFFLSQQ